MSYDECCRVFMGIRIAFLSSLFDTVLMNILVLDSDWYYRWAVSLAKGFGHPDGPFWIGPGYPMALAGLFKATGSIAIKLIPVAQILLSMLTVFFLVFDRAENFWVMRPRLSLPESPPSMLRGCTTTE